MILFVSKKESSDDNEIINLKRHAAYVSLNSSTKTVFLQLKLQGLKSLDKLKKFFSELVKASSIDFLLLTSFSILKISPTHVEWNKIRAKDKKKNVN